MQLNTWFLRRFFKCSSPVISLFENSKIRKYSKKEPKTAPIFIIGPPRSGSTILYQIITNFFDVSYINNLCHLSRRNLFFSFWLSNLLFKNKKHNSFESNYGNTQKFGLNAPSEGGQIWYKWFDKNKIYFEKDDLSPKYISQIRNTFNAISSRFKRPIVIKNLMFSQRIKVLHQIFPNAKFIFIKRSPEFNAQSIFIARNKQQNMDWWSTEPKTYKDLLNLSLIEQSVSHVYYLEKQIHEDLKLFHPDNVSIVRYENLMNNFNATITNIGNFIGADMRGDYSNFILKTKDTIKVKIEDFNFIQEIVNKFDWEHYKSE